MQLWLEDEARVGVADVVKLLSLKSLTDPEVAGLLNQ